ncbi:lactonase family protein [Lachnoclostridium phytofermentans]|uniref:3-carboxymuconate cyclase-like protein n=1 Tax=Lachnoclostridium phytofermentans (strain ATCC 700394 / DSM 18823 / ISDg) TaxID=357809 RepID=A9KS86_LACP7|nr:beta-propeller fold lactonase family protein [Lachnoclostridium phytofermentans]ABX42118.1 3-carboxymuconate cyclase-like protein [Lachnoclostridium phytofermentans ISDg]
MELIISGYGAKTADTIKGFILEEDGAFHENWKDSLENPSFVCQVDGYLFTVTENDGAVIYLYGREGQGYQLLDQKRIDGSALCHITYSPKNKALFGACYGTGTLFAVRVESGHFGDILHHEIQQEGTARTRAHCVLLNHMEDRLVTVNIALNRIFIYAINQGYLTLERSIKAPEGSGPRHALFSEDESYLYVITEYSNEIFVYDLMDEDRLVQRISTLTSQFNGISYCSTLCFSQNNAYLYAANRGAETIALFSVSSDGRLSYLEEYDCGGQNPRHMILSEDGKKLLVCNQNSHQVICFQLDTEQGSIIGKLGSQDFTSPSGILEVKR